LSGKTLIFQALAGFITYVSRNGTVSSSLIWWTTSLSHWHQRINVAIVFWSATRAILTIKLVEQDMDKDMDEV
jgi:hypothetical protein